MRITRHLVSHIHHGKITLYYNFRRATKLDQAISLLGYKNLTRRFKIGSKR